MNLHVQGSNIEFYQYLLLVQNTMSAVRTQPGYFGTLHEFSTILDAERYVRLHDNASGLGTGTGRRRAKFLTTQAPPGVGGHQTLRRWLERFRHHYNNNRTNQALDGRTPAEEVLN